MRARGMTIEAVPERATIPILGADEVRSSSERALAAAAEQVARIHTADRVLEAWDDVATILEDAFGPISLLNSVHPDKSVRDACDVALVQESSFLTEVFQNEAFFEAVSRAETPSQAERELRKQLLEAFEDSGVSLAPEKRQRFREISERLTELGQEFAKDIRENTSLRFTPDQCRGLPQSWLDRISRDEQGHYVVGFDYPDYVPFMMNSLDPQARRRYWTANTLRGTARNLDVLDEIVALRKRDRRPLRSAELRPLRHQAADGRESGDRHALLGRRPQHRHRGRAARPGRAGAAQGGDDRRSHRYKPPSSVGTSPSTASACANGNTPSIRKRCASISRRRHGRVEAGHHRAPCTAAVSRNRQCRCGTRT
jgi:hypothetical protein